ncbi:hypothetical protein BpHYR1_000824 [Brachionus plicatilis]|uniref:Uncharacterized protein n=1 Tax=Brachionus plicatilis TaxID=10195 RepID=A0A3M7QKG0_BRAPC|nr:hypothetical protein BpHYR1_000824 [Brachionus plicatilis]
MYNLPSIFQHSTNYTKLAHSRQSVQIFGPIRKKIWSYEFTRNQVSKYLLTIIRDLFLFEMRFLSLFILIFK